MEKVEILKHKDDLITFQERADKEYLEGKRQAAEDIFSNILTISDQIKDTEFGLKIHTFAQLRMGEISKNRNEIKVAITHFENALKENAFSSIDYKLECATQYADLLAANGLPKERALFIKSFLDTFPKGGALPDELVQIPIERIKSKQPELAIPALEFNVAIAQKAGDTLFQLSQLEQILKLHLNKGDKLRAKQIADAFVKASQVKSMPEKNEVANKLVSFATLLGSSELPGVEHCYRRALELYQLGGSGNSRGALSCYTHIGYALLQKNKLLEAKQCFEKALSIGNAIDNPGAEQIEYCTKAIESIENKLHPPPAEQIVSSNESNSNFSGTFSTSSAARIPTFSSRVNRGYSSDTERHYILENHNGEVIKLDDGSVWKVTFDTATTSIWIPMTDVMIVDDEKMINLDDGESVDVERL